MKLTKALRNKTFLALVFDAGIPLPDAEVMFAPPRKWRFDYGWPHYKLALEVEGGIFGRGRVCPMCHRPAAGGHTSIAGLKRDIEKGNAAALLGWRLLRVVPTELNANETIDMIKEALNGTVC